MTELRVRGLAALREVRPGDDLAALLAGAGAGALEPGDVLVVAHKVVSKAEGAVVALDDVRPGRRARELAATLAKDPRHVQVVLDQSAAVLRAERGVLSAAPTTASCARTPAWTPPTPPPGPSSASRATLTPRPARCASRCPPGPAVVITDSFGRAWRHGQADVAIGIAGLAPLEDWRGRADAGGRELRATWIALADQVAAAADLVRTKDGAPRRPSSRGSNATSPPRTARGQRRLCDHCRKTSSPEGREQRCKAAVAARSAS